MTIIILLLLLSLGSITFLVSFMISRDLRVTAEDSNFTANAQAASATETILRSVSSAVVFLLNSLDEVPSPEAVERLCNYFFEENRNIAAVLLPEDGGIPKPGSASFLLNQGFFQQNEIDPSLIAAYAGGEGESLRRAFAGEALIQNGAPVFEIPMLVFFLPLSPSGSQTNRAALIFFSSDSLTQPFGAGSNVSYLINAEGDLLVHPDHSLVRSGRNIGDEEFIKTMRASGDLSRQTLYTDSQGLRYFGAYTQLSLANLAVITSVEYNVVFEGIAATTRRNIYLSAAVLFLSVLLIWFFSKTISVPVKHLAAAATRIKEGEFEISLKAEGRDEIGLLTENFVEMGRGLAERERLKDTFGRFINKEIAERAMRGELGLGGETKQVTIFFSDIRDFTAISERLEPYEVVAFLNDYMTRMVACVNDTGGVVDKFIGDAVLAVWGAPVSTGDRALDALACVRAALMMRESLKEFNRGRGDFKKPLIRIGCGINTGDVVAGQIGSSERMEYTVIGDAVNLASRTEGLNKPLATDILVTEYTWDLVKDQVVAEEMPSVTVKGKEKPLRLFAVINLREEGLVRQGPQNLAELRQFLGVAAPDLGKVNLGEEKKYKIGNE
jgi:adenylate cyclase